jgi:hypothetical protein
MTDDNLARNLAGRGYRLVTHQDHEHYHEDCAECRAETEAAYREHIGSYRAEASQRESIALARADLDMADAPESEVMASILINLK